MFFLCKKLFCDIKIMVARRGAHLAAERGGAEHRQGAARSAAVPNGEGVASGSTTHLYFFFTFLHSSLCGMMPFTPQSEHENEFPQLQMPLTFGLSIVKPLNSKLS